MLAGCGKHSSYSFHVTVNYTDSGLFVHNQICCFTVYPHVNNFHAVE